MDYKEKVIALLNSQELSKEQKEKLENIFPKLKESEDENIRLEIRNFIWGYPEKLPERDKWLAWLEKQGNKSVNIDVESMVSSYEQRLESQGGTKYTPLVNMCLTAFRHGVENVLDELNLKKPEKQGENEHTDKVEPKFKVGDWIVATGKCVYLITKIDKFTVTLVDVIGNEYEFSTDSLNDATLWTIQDAMEGDVLINWNNTTFIFKAIEDKTVKFHIAYNEKLNTIKTPLTKLSHQGLAEPQFEFHPATKEQRDTLFAKMEESGYEWDSEKKELKKIESKKLDVWNAEDEQNLNVVLSFIEDECLRRWLKDKLCYDKEDGIKILDADKVIEWLKNTIREVKERYGNYGVYYDTQLVLPYNSIEDFINDFKEDFGLC